VRATQFGKVRGRTVSDAVALELESIIGKNIRFANRVVHYCTTLVQKDALSAEQGRVSIAINGVALFLAML
jgi:hypothetical protein